MLNLMIIDDEENIRLGIAEGIDWHSYDLNVCCTAKNGEEALSLAKIHLPEIILFDINMPLLDGLSFLKQAKLFLPQSKYIVLSGYSEFEYARTALKLEVFDYLLKPIAPNSLIETVLRAKEQLLVHQPFQKFVLDFQKSLEEEFCQQLLSGNSFCLKSCSDLLDIYYTRHNFNFSFNQDSAIHLAQYLIFDISGLPENFRTHMNEVLSELSLAIPELSFFNLKEILLTKVSQYLMTYSAAPSPRNEVDHLKIFIEDNYSLDLNLKNLAEKVYMNPNYLSTLFKNQVGDTIGNYITKIRITHAKNLLSNSDLKINAIAQMTGYQNANYFSYAFKKQTGMTPNEYRNTNQHF